MKKISPPHGSLKALYLSPRDPRIEEDMVNFEKNISIFVEKFRTIWRNEHCTTAEALKAIQEYENLFLRGILPSWYSSLHSACDQSNSKAHALATLCESRFHSAMRNLVWFESELTRHPALEMWSETIELKKYRGWLVSLSVTKKHLLSDDAEKIFLIKMYASRNAWADLHALISAQRTFIVGKKKMSLSEIRSLLSDSNSAKRRVGLRALLDGAKADAPLCAHALSTLITDRIAEAKTRGWESPDAPAHASAGLSSVSVNALREVYQKSRSIARRYYKAKADAMGVKVLDRADRLAPLPGMPTKKIFWNDALRMIHDAFNNFSPIMSQQVEIMQKNNCILAYPTKRKRAGAFCSSAHPAYPTYVHMSYLNTLDDVFTLAHELGHAAHHLLMRDVPYLAYGTAKPLAETASVFGEYLLRSHVRSIYTRADQHLALLSAEIDDEMNTLFSQMMYDSFEKSLYDHVWNGKTLDVATINALWKKASDDLYGNSLSKPVGYEYGWVYILHFFIYGFYVYSYSAANCVVRALIHLYESARTESEKESFKKSYFKLLAAGGTLPPRELLLSAFDIDCEKSTLWEAGFSAVDELVKKFEKGVKEISQQKKK